MKASTMSQSLDDLIYNIKEALVPFSNFYYKL